MHNGLWTLNPKPGFFDWNKELGSAGMDIGGMFGGLGLRGLGFKVLGLGFMGFGVGEFLGGGGG